MRFLDVGCGPGSISVGLAAAVAPGEFHGLDMAQSQIDLATSVAEKAGLVNAQFRVGDVMAFPFPDGHFDVVHCHAVLMHIPDTGSALREMNRVLKSGGILGARELVADSCFIEPDMGNLSNLYGIFARVLSSNGGHPQMGKELKAGLASAGFADIEPTGTVENFFPPAGSRASIGFETFRGGILGAINSEPAIELGLATTEEFSRWNKAFLTWQEDPGAIGGYVYGEVIGRKP
jgi:ubiquinone/menaquinone biosynthesis C-methylase UbiE